VANLFVEYEIVATAYGGWGLKDIKNMPVRERRFWLSMIRWRRERNG
jgi:hypothetical protein